MANETNYTFDEMVVYKETAEAVIPANPVGLKVAGLINLSVTDTQKTETNQLLNTGGQGSKKDRGTSDYAGNMECKIIGDSMPFIATHAIGAPTSKTALTSEAWALNTTYAKYDPYDLTAGDVVLHSNGVTNLVCKVAGTSSGTEPTQTVIDDAGNGGTIVDGTVTWIVRGILYKYEGESEHCIGTFGGEYQANSGCYGAAEVFKKRFQGNYLNSYEIAKSNGTIIHKYSLPIVAMSASDNVTGNPDGSDFVSIKDVAGYTEVTLNDLPFGYDDLEVKVGGAEPVNGRNFRMMINRNVSIEDATKRQTKISNTPQMTVEGEVALKFTKEEYLKAFNNETVEVIATFGKQNGDMAAFTFSETQKDRVDPVFTPSEPSYLTIPLTASGDNLNPTINYVLVSEINY